MGNLFGNTLFYGDNLPILRTEVEPASVDLVYLDPPFNSQQNYNVLFRDHSGKQGAAQIHAFDDTWTWGDEAERTLFDLMHGESAELANLAQALRAMLGKSDMLAYLVMMAPRLVELRRVLKPTGSLYLHCDPTSGHYLKVLLDAIFGPRNFRNEVVWRRSTPHNDARRWSTNSDRVLFYGRSDIVTWNAQHAAHSVAYVASKYRFDDRDGRGPYRLDNMTSPNPRPNLTFAWRGHQPPPNGWRYSRERMQALHDDGRIWYPDTTAKRPQLKRYLAEQPGPVVEDVWTDIPPVNARAAERLGYPTQKPVALLERIIAASSNPGDLVLDPFCGCGTTVDAAQKLGRHWTGIDISTLAIDIIDRRMRDTYGESIAGTYEVRGIPRDIEGARALFRRDPFEFERWAVLHLDARPSSKQVGDRGVDGTAWFWTGGATDGRIIISVKGGANNPGFVRDLAGTVEGHGAQLGVMVTLNPPTRGMLQAASMAGIYTHPNGQQYPRVQIVTVAQLLIGERPDWPPMLRPGDREAEPGRPSARRATRRASSQAG